MSKITLNALILQNMIIMESLYAKLIREKRILDLIILLLLSIVVYHTWFKPGVISYGDWVPWSRESMLSLLSPPYGTGASNSYPIDLLHGILSNIGLNYSVIERMIWFYPYVFLSFFSMYFLSYILFKERIICFFSSMIYAFNTYATVTIGNMTLGMGYALAPLIIAFFIKALNEKRIRYGLISGLIFSISLSYDMRMAYLTSIVIILYISFRFLISLKFSSTLGEFSRNIRVFIIVIVCTFIMPLILHAFWTIPAIILVNPPSPSAIYTVPSSIMKEMNLYNGMFLLHIHRWSAPSISFIWHILPVMVFISIILHPKNRDIIFFTLLALIGIFLLKGIYPPHKEIYIWLFTHIPGFNAFREPSKFYMIIAMSYALLFGVTSYTIAKKIEKAKIFIKKVEFTKIARFTFLILILMLIISSLKPIITKQPSYILNVHEIPSEYLKIEKFHHLNPGKTLIYPENINYNIGTISLYHSSFLRYFLGIWQGPSPAYLNQTNHIGKILGIKNIKYVILTPGLENTKYQAHRSDLPHYSPIEIMDRQLDIRKFSINDNITAYENIEVLPPIYAASNSAMVVGGRKALLSLSLFNINFSKWVLFFSDQLKDYIFGLWNNSEVIIFYDKSIDDLLLSGVDKKYYMNLHQYGNFRPEDASTKSQWLNEIPETNYWVYYFGEFQQSSAIESNWYAKMNISKNIEKTGMYEIWVRAGFGSNNGVFKILVDGTEINSTKFYSNGARFRWTKVGNIFLNKGEHIFSLNSNGRNSLDGLVIIPNDVINKSRNDIHYLLSQKKKIFIYESENNLDPIQGKWSVSNKFGGYASNGKVFEIDTPTASASMNIEVPNDDEYTFAIHVAIDNFLGNLTIFVDGKPIFNIDKIPNKLTWFEGNLQLKRGNHNFSFFKYGKGKLYIDELILYSPSSKKNLSKNIPKSVIYIPKVDQSQIGVEWDYPAGAGYSIGQSFTTGSNVTKLLKVELVVKHPGESPNADAILKLYKWDTNYSTTVNGTVLASATIPASKITSSYQWITIDLNAPVLPNTKYLIELSSSTTNSGFQWGSHAWTKYKGGELYQNKGILTPNEEDFAFKTYYAYPIYVTRLNATTIHGLNDLFFNKNSIAITHKRINPVKYEVKLKTDTSPFLIFTNNYDPIWVAKFNGTETRPIPAYSVTNGFLINKTGEINVMIEYSSQKYIDIGFYISVFGFIFIIGYLLVSSSFVRKMLRKL